MRQLKLQEGHNVQNQPAASNGGAKHSGWSDLDDVLHDAETELHDQGFRLLAEGVARARFKLHIGAARAAGAPELPIPADRKAPYAGIHAAIRLGIMVYRLNSGTPGGWKHVPDSAELQAFETLRAAGERLNNLAPGFFSIVEMLESIRCNSEPNTVGTLGPHSAHVDAINNGARAALVALGWPVPEAKCGELSHEAKAREDFERAMQSAAVDVATIAHLNDRIRERLRERVAESRRGERGALLRAIADLGEFAEDLGAIPSAGMANVASVAGGVRAFVTGTRRLFGARKAR